MKNNMLKGMKPVTLPVSSHPTITAPLIDKISAVVDLHDKALCGLAYSSILDWIEGDELGVRRVKGSGKFPLAVAIHLPDVDGVIHFKRPHLLLQITSKQAPQCQVRAEWNPMYLNENAEEHLAVMFIELFGMEFYDFLYHARFTRVDFCRNIMMTSLEDLLVMVKYSRVSHNSFGQDGMLGTVTFGAPAGNQFKLYEKSKQLYGVGADNPFVRVEALLRLNLKASALMAIPNPFNRVQLFDIGCNKPPFGTAHLRAFQDSCRLRGIRNALKRQPADVRGKLKKYIIERPVTWWWITDEDWNWLLQNALDIAGLLNIPSYAPPLTLKYGVGCAA